MKFRKKPVVVEAVQVKIDNVVEVFEFCPLVKTASRAILPSGEMSKFQFIINTLEGDMTCGEGDWIIKGVKGEFYPCQNDIFQMTYDKIEGEE